MTSFPSDDIRRFAPIFALAQTGRNPSDYTFSFSRGPQLTTMPVTIRTKPPGPIALRGAGIIHAVETDEYRSLVPERDMTFGGTDGEAGNDDFAPVGPRYDNLGFSEYAIEHVDTPQPLLEGAPKTLESVSHAARKLVDRDELLKPHARYTKQQAIQMISRACLGTRISPRAVIIHCEAHDWRIS